ncbi:MAG TPA: tetratricopeptide repeat protein [Atribacteraceae bacterium]|nr:tetratricopeptide repeat protein [Atribacteraceae bacterium]
MIPALFLAVALIALYLTSREAIRSMPPDILSLCREAYFFLKQKKYREALNSYTAALALKPDSLEALANRGNAHYFLGEYDQALSDYTRSIKIKPTLSTAYNNRGFTFMTMGHLTEAIDDFSQAVQYDPHLSEAYYNRAEAYSEKGEVTLALADYEQARKLNPADKDVLFRRASLLLKSENQQELALADLNEFIENNDAHPQARYLRGLFYFEQGEYQKAIDDFTRVIALNPSSFRSFYRRGLCQAEQGEYQKAIDDFSRTIGLNPGYFQAFYRRGSLWLEVKEHEQASADFSRVIEINPRSFKAYAYRALCRQAMGDYDQARKDLATYFSGEGVSELWASFPDDPTSVDRHLKHKDKLDEDLSAELEMEDLRERKATEPDEAVRNVATPQDGSPEAGESETVGPVREEAGFAQETPAGEERSIFRAPEEVIAEIIHLAQKKSETGE